MRNKFLALCLSLLLVLPYGLALAESNPWDHLPWASVPGGAEAEEGINPANQNMPHASLDIVGDTDRLPAQFALDETYIYFELRVAGEIDLGSDKDYCWMALFFPPEVTSDPTGNFNDAILQAGLRIVKDNKINKCEVVVISVGSNGTGHDRTEEASFDSADYYDITADGDDQLVRWKVPLTYLANVRGYTLATGKNHNDVPNQDWIGWSNLYDEAYNLTVTVDPTGGGSVAGQDSDKYEEGDEITLTATPEENYEFAGWEVLSEDWTYDGDLGQPELSFAMPGHDLSLKANFTLIPEPELYELTVTVDPEVGGSVTGQDSDKYEEGDEVTLTASPHDNYEFAGWEVLSADWTYDGDLSQPELSFTMPGQDLSLKANFTLIPEPELYELTVTVDPEAGGNVTGQDSIEYEADDEITLTATPEENYEFAGWEVLSEGWAYEGDLTKPILNFTMPEHDLKLKATFTLIQQPVLYSLTVGVNPAGSGTVTGQGSGDFEYNDEVTLTAAPASGYRFIGWELLTGTWSYEGAVNETSITFLMPDSDLILRANFRVRPIPEEPEAPEEPVDPEEPGQEESIEDETEEPGQELPVTGTNVNWLFPLGLALLAAGAVALRRLLTI